MTETTRILRRGPVTTKRVVSQQLLGELEKVLPSPTLTGKNLYHYTTQAGLLGVAKDRAMWMTDIRHLNDSTEFEYAMGLVRKKIDTKYQEQKDASYRDFLSGMAGLLNVFEAYTKYVACFSEDGDSLSQWRGYTDNGTGFNIAWKDKTLNSLADKQFHRLVKCVYDPEEHEKIIERLFSAVESKFEPDWKAPANNGLFFFLLFLGCLGIREAGSRRQSLQLMQAGFAPLGNSHLHLADGRTRVRFAHQL